MGSSSMNVCGAQNPKYAVVVSAVLEAAHQVQASGGGIVIMFKGFSTTAGFVQIHDSAGVPVEGAVPLSMMAVAANDNFAFNIPVCGMPPMTKGLYVCFSTTGPTKTLGGAACFFELYMS